MALLRIPTLEVFALGIAMLGGAAAGCSSGRASSSSMPGCDDCVPANPIVNVDDLDGDGRPNADDRCDGRLLGRLIVLDSQAGSSVAQAVEADLAPLLEQVSGGPFETVPKAQGACAEEQTAIWLLRASSIQEHTAPERVISRVNELQGVAPQSYVLDTRRGAGVWIVSSTDRGLVHGVYELLERVGVRFLLPGDDWIVAPPRADLSFDAQLLRTPTFRTLSYFGTGGFGPSSSQFPLADVGGDGLHARSLQSWWRRSRFPNQYQLNGHTWEDFSSKPEISAALEADPRMLACRPCASDDVTCLAGAQDAWCGDRPAAQYRRLPASAARLNPTYHGPTLCGEASAPRTCVLNEAPTLEDIADFATDGGLMQLYGADLLERLEGSAQAAIADPSLEAMASVDASDGDGFCVCEKCRDMLRNGSAAVDRDANVTDGIFHMANDMARRAASAHPGSSVNLYAYASRASVPTIALEPNVFVVLVPYGFQQQHTGLSGAELVAAWAAKSAANPPGPFRLGMYDYWALTDGSLDQPTYPLAKVASSLASWRNSGIEAVTNESTYGSGAMGPQWYVAARLAWDPELNVDALVEDWFVQAFGSAAAPLQRMYQRFWSLGYSADPVELGAIFAALQEAETLEPNDQAVRKRLTAFHAYALYLRLLYELRSAPADAQAAALDAVLTHIWRIAPSGMVHSFRLWQLLSSQYGSPARWAFDSSAEHGAAWDAVNAAGPVTADEMRQRSAESAVLYPHVELLPASDEFTGPLVPLTTALPGATTDASEAGYGDEWEGKYAFYLLAGQNVSLSVGIMGRSAAIPDARIIVEDPAGTTLVDRRVPVPLEGELTQTIDVQASSSGVYRLTYQNAFNEFHVLRYPESLWLVRDLPSDFSYFVPERRHWFFVPPGTRRFAFRSDCDQQALFRGPAGDVAATWHGNVAVVDVASPEAGNAWSMSSYCGSAQFLNIPNHVAYRPEQLLVPQDALP